MTAFASAEGAKTRVKGLSMKFVRIKIERPAKMTFLKERRRGFLRDRCILGRSPCELLTSAFARKGQARSATIHCTSPAMHGVMGLRMVETIKLASNESSSKPQT